MEQDSVPKRPWRPALQIDISLPSAPLPFIPTQLYLHSAVLIISSAQLPPLQSFWVD